MRVKLEYFYNRLKLECRNFAQRPSIPNKIFYFSDQFLKMSKVESLACIVQQCRFLPTVPFLLVINSQMMVLSFKDLKSLLKW